MGEEGVPSRGSSLCKDLEGCAGGWVLPLEQRRGRVEARDEGKWGDRQGPTARGLGTLLRGLDFGIAGIF